jgi:hypothetical protein
LTLPNSLRALEKVLHSRLNAAIDAQACTIPVTHDTTVNAKMTSAIQNVQNCCGLRRSRHS